MSNFFKSVIAALLFFFGWIGFLYFGLLLSETFMGTFSFTGLEFVQLVVFFLLSCAFIFLGVFLIRRRRKSIDTSKPASRSIIILNSILNIVAVVFIFWGISYILTEGIRFFGATEIKVLRLFIGFGAFIGGMAAFQKDPWSRTLLIGASAGQLYETLSFLVRYTSSFQHLLHTTWKWNFLLYFPVIAILFLIYPSVGKLFKNQRGSKTDVNSTA